MICLLQEEANGFVLRKIFKNDLTGGIATNTCNWGVERAVMVIGNDLVMDMYNKIAGPFLTMLLQHTQELKHS